MDTTECTQTAREIMNQYGLSDWAFQLDGALSRKGYCRFSPRIISLGKVFVELNTPERVRYTILHEVAHALVGAGQGHNFIWQCKVKQIGGIPNRCTSAVVETVHAERKHQWKCTKCGFIFRRYCKMDYSRSIHTGCGGSLQYLGKDAVQAATPEGK